VTETVVGTSGTTQEGLDKVTARHATSTTITLSGMLYGATVRSPGSRGTIKAISFDPRLSWGSLSPSRRRIFRQELHCA